MKVPFLDLKAQYRSIEDEVKAGIEDVLQNTAFAGGPFVAKFEEEYAKFCNCQFAIGCSSGTSALWLSLLAMGVGPGDEVITAANTFIATAEAISYTGAKPVFVDVVEETYNIDPAKIEAAITPRTKAIIPVHLYGQMADMDPIMGIAKKHNLYVIEDASQAHGAEYNGRAAGSIGDLGCFSFYPGKNLGAYGEAGGVVTDNQELADKMKMLRDHGQSKKYYHDLVGWNARMDGLQGAVLSVKLKYIKEWNEGRNRNAALYNELLADVEGLRTPPKAGYARHVYHIYAVQVEDRDAFMSYLGAKGIASGIHYPIPLHVQDAYKDLVYSEGDFPVAERLAKGQVSLPMFAELTREQIEFVTQEIKNYVNESAGVPA